MSLSFCTDPNILLRIKNLIMLSINTSKCYGYTVNVLELLHMRDHYNEVKEGLITFFMIVKY